ncbi:MAG: terminase large subunit [Rhodobacteraceae bacterium]|nr:terminase large subunit [Paracoccaceae bacterium]
MGLRGVGAKPKLAVVGSDQSAFGFAQDEVSPLRNSMPWEVEGLNRLERVIAFLEDLKITQGSLAGTNLKLRQWQVDFLAAIYAEDDKGGRPVRTAVLSVGRKNGKTQLIAGMALCHLLGPEAEGRGEVYAAANDREQAGKCFAEMIAILSEHPELSARINIVKFSKRIEVLHGFGKGSIFVALSADAATKHGLSPSFTVYDELGQAPKRDLYEALDTAMGARDNPLMCVISTQAADDHAVMSELVDYGIKVNDGEITDKSFHLTLFTAPESDDPWRPETWAKANPALGDFRSLEDVERQALQAERVPSRENAFRNLILNQRVAAHVRFIAKAEWDVNGRPVDLEALKGRVCYGGLDLSASRDLTAFVLVFPNDRGGFDVVPQFFLPEKNIKDKSEADRVPYDLWAKQGFLTLNPGATVDPSFVAHAMAEAATLYDIRTIAYDRWRIENIQRELAEIGCDVPLEPFGQGFKDMAPAVDKLERMVAETKLSHAGHPILTYCAANAVVERDAAGNRKLAKHKSSGRIDGLVALAMALGVTDKFEEEAIPSCLADLLD